MVLSFVTVIFTTRLIGPAGYGTVVMVGLLAMLLFTASTAWTSVSVRRYGREDLELRGGMSRLTWNRVIIGAPLVATGVIVLVALKLAGVLAAEMTWTMVALAIATGVANIFMDHWVCVLETVGRMKVSAVAQVLRQASYVGALIVLVAIGAHVSAITIVVLTLVSAILFTVGAMPWVWTSGVVPLETDRALLRRMVWLSVPVIGLMASQYVFSSVDVFVLRIFRSRHDVGVYAVAYQAYNVLSAVAVSATAVLVPLFVSVRLAGREELVKRYLRRVLPQGIFVTAVTAGLLIPAAPLLVPVVFGDQFQRAGRPLCVLALGLVFLFASYLVAPILTLHEQTRTTATINAVAAAINVVGDFVLIGVLGVGIMAPAVATTVGLAAVYVGYQRHARRLLAEPSRPSPIHIAPAVAGMVPPLLLPAWSGFGGGVLAAGLVTAAILRWQPPFSAEDIDLVEKLDLPDRVKTLAVRGISALA